MNKLLQMFGNKGDYIDRSFYTDIVEENGKNIRAFQTGGYHANRVQ
jgi:membrane peptidoglycan carboxypeptidase